MKKFPANSYSSFLCVALVGLLVFIATPSFALVIYNAGEPSTQDGGFYLSDVDESLSGSGNRQQIGGYFILEPGLNVINDIHWWGVYSSNEGPIAPGADDFTIRLFSWNIAGYYVETPYFYENNIGNDVNRTDSLLDVTYSGYTYNIYEYYLNLDPIELVSDTYYLLSIFNDTVGMSYNWSWSRSDDYENGIGASAFRYSSTGSPDGLAWINFYSDMAFNLTHTAPVPEPATMLLLGSGLAGLVAFRRKFKK